MTRILAAVLLLLLAVVRAAGGVVLILRGPAAVDSDLVGPGIGRALGLGLLAVGVLAIAAAVGLIRRRRWGGAVAIATTLLFVFDGAINGYLLFGRPGAGGTAANLIAAVGIVALVLLARRSGDLDASNPQGS